MSPPGPPSLADTPAEVYSLLLLEGFLCGVYSGIFALYLQCHAFKEGTGNARKIIFYALCILYLLSVVLFVLDFLVSTTHWQYFQLSFQFYLFIFQPLTFVCCDFIAQSIQIYRCWIVWDRNICVVIIPSILTLAYLGLWLAAEGEIYTTDSTIQLIRWETIEAEIYVPFPMAVNALVTGLIVYKIFKAFREVQQGSTPAEKSLDVIGGRKYRSLIFVIIESGIALFVIQLLRIILRLPPFSNSTPIIFTSNFIVAIHHMLNGITPTIILVRVSIGLSFDENRSLEEVTESLCFASYGPSPNSIPEMGNIDRQEWRDNEIDGNEDIQAMGSTIQRNQMNTEMARSIR